MDATVIDKKRRLTLPKSVCKVVGLKPGDQVTCRVEVGEIRGSPRLAQESREVFPPGSLLKYLTPERDRRELAILSRLCSVTRTKGLTAKVSQTDFWSKC